MSATEEKFGPKLNLTIVHCSSEDANFPISELQRHTAGTHGWQSAQQCEYPVELGFRFDGETTLDYLRILSHESKITSKLEVFICEATDEDRATQTFPPYDKAVFRRLGHIKFSTNEDKDFEARELKTVNVHRDVLYLKLLLRQCHPNGVNIFNQVGIVALSVHGRLLVPFPRPVGANAVDHSLELIMNAQDAADEVPLDQMTPQKVLTIRGTAVDSDTGAGDDGAHDVNSIKTGSETDELDPTTAKKIKELTIHKARAVSEEDYDLAKALKEMIATLKHNGRQIAQLEVRKRHAVEEEDYDTAKQLKMQIDALRAEAMRKPAANASRAPLVPQPPFARHESGGGGLRGAHQGAFGNDDIPVGGGGGGAFGGGPVGHDAPASFDERPAVARAQPQPSEYPDESAAAQPPAPRPAPFGRAAPAHGPTSHDDRPAVAQTPASLDEILKQGDSGGIVVTSKPAAAPLKTAAFDGPSMAPWERALNAVVVKLSGDQPPADALAAPKLTEYKEFIGAFGTYVTSCFFCKRWQLREAAITAIVSQEGFDALVGVKGSSAVAVGVSLLSYLGSKGHGVQDTISQVFFATCDALKKLICQETRPVAPIAQLANPLFALLPDLMLKAGDSNQRIREQATSILMLLAMSTLGAERVSAAALAEPETQGKRPLNHRVHVARTSLVGVLLDKVGLNRKDARTGLTVDAIMTRLCLPCLQHSHQDVREGAMDVIVQLHHIAGAASVAPFLNDVKPAQRALIDEQLAKGGAAAAVGSGGAPPGAAAAAHGGGAAAGRGSGAAGGRNADQEMASSSISVEGNQKSAVLAAAREAKRQQQGGAAAIPAAPAGAAGGKKSAAAAPGKQAAPSPKKKDPADEARTCQFCGKFDKRFNEATLDVHYVRTCPMLCPCPLCGQVTEIASLQEHLVNECDRKSLVRKCPMCHEAVRAEDLDAHVAAKACIPAKPAEYSICPLCHAKLQPGERGWMQHLLQAPGCRNNPRRWDGGNGEEFN